jgi:hypothetical protein
MLTANHVLISLAILAVWLLSLWVHPFGKCHRCRGRRMVIKGKKRPRPVQCRVCKGIGRRQRIGSRTLHRTVRRIRRELDRQRKARQSVAAAMTLEEDR